MPADPHSPLDIGEYSVQGVRVLEMSGLLDSTTYLRVRDRVIKAALDQPSAVVVDVTGLTAPAESAWSVFTSARWHLSIWPEVPIALVSERVAGRHALARNGITRYLPVYGTVAAALSAAADALPPGRRRARTELPADRAGIVAARVFVTEWLTTWSQTELISAASVVVTALVGNAWRHTVGAPRLRLESDGVVVTVAVEDGSKSLPARQEQLAAEANPTGLQMVEAASRVWGAAPTPDGKVVWAVIGPENRL
jgi:hypothetical protein